jgi:hypothetical protein
MSSTSQHLRTGLYTSIGVATVLTAAYGAHYLLKWGYQRFYQKNIYDTFHSSRLSGSTGPIGPINPISSTVKFETPYYNKVEPAYTFVASSSTSGHLLNSSNNKTPLSMYISSSTQSNDYNNLCGPNYSNSSISIPQ